MDKNIIYIGITNHRVMWMAERKGGGTGGGGGARVALDPSILDLHTQTLHVDNRLFHSLSRQPPPPIIFPFRCTMGLYQTALCT